MKNNHSSIINEEKLLINFDYDYNLLQTIFDTFFTTLPEKLAQLKTSIDKKDYPQIEKIIHNLKGIFLQFAADKSAELSEDICTQCKNQDSIGISKNYPILLKQIEEITYAAKNITL